MSSSTAFRIAGLLGLLIASVWPLAAADTSEDAVDLKIHLGGRDVTNSVGVKLKRIPAGTFLMGAGKDEGNAEAQEKPQHEVEITRDFHLGTTEVTQKQWQAVMGNNPSVYSRNGSNKASVQNVLDKDLDDFPVETVTWHDTQEFCKKLSGLPAERNARRTYRLPSEAEWEYACRAGAKTPTKYSFGDEIAFKDANYSGNGIGRTVKVASYAANAWGLYDMHGNAYEWVQDNHSPTYYATSPRRDPEGPENGPNKVLRGGAHTFAAHNIRTAYRLSWGPQNKNHDVGFRVVMEQGR